MVVTILILLGIFRIIDTYDHVTISPDEFAHIGTGIEWLDNGTYNFEALHPPLSRIMVALLPYYVDNAHMPQSFYKEYSYRFNDATGYKKSYFGRNIAGKEIMMGDTYKKYKYRLFLSRVGTIPFFILCGITLFLWCRKIYDTKSAIVATFLFSTMPIVLANAGLSTTDMAAAATLLISLYALDLWLESPSFKRTIFLGTAVGLVFISKFSGIIFFVGCAAAALITKDLSEKNISKGYKAEWVKSIGIISFLVFFIVWAGYRFSTCALSYPYFIYQAHWDAFKDLVVSLGMNGEIVTKISSLEIVPFPEFFQGLSDLKDRNGIKYAGYILNQVQFYTGVWYFFPIAIIFKTPLAFLLLFVGSLKFLWDKYNIKRDWRVITPIVSSLIILLIAMTGNLNIGLRHVLPIYPLMCMIVGFGVIKIFEQKHIIPKALTALLIIWYTVSTTWAHPNYIPYFNFLAGDAPEDILIDSDFDIGHELEFLAKELKKRGIEKDTKLYYSGYADPAFFGIENYKIFFNGILEDFKIEYGDEKYLALSIAFTKILPPNNLKSLENCAKPEKIGLTSLLYDLNTCKRG